MKQLLLASSVVMLVFGTTEVLADSTADSDTKLINSMSGVKPLTPAETAQAKAAQDAAKAKWAAMTPAQKTAVMQSMKNKNIADMTDLELQAENDTLPVGKNATAKEKAEHDAAQAKWAAMTPDEKAAARKSAQQKRAADLNAMERAAEEDRLR